MSGIENKIGTGNGTKSWTKQVKEAKEAVLGKKEETRKKEEMNERVLNKFERRLE